MGRERTFLQVEGAEIYRDVCPDSSGVLFPIGGGRIVGVCVKCESTFRTQESLMGAVCPHCGENNFLPVEWGWKSSPRILHKSVGEKNIIYREVATLSFKDNRVICCFNNIQQNIATYDTISNSLTFHEHYWRQWEGVTKKDFQTLFGNDGVVDFLERVKVLDFSSGFRGFYDNFFDEVVTSYFENPKLAEFGELYPELISSIIDNEDFEALKSIATYDDICKALNVTEEVKPYMAIMFSGKSFRHTEKPFATIVQNLKSLPYGDTILRYAERGALTKDALYSINEAMSFANSYSKGEKREDCYGFLHDVSEGAKLFKGPVYHEIPKSVVELFLEFQAKNCLIFGDRCWRTFIDYVHSLMLDGVVVTMETLDVKNYHIYMNQQKITKQKFHDLVASAPLEAIDYI